MTSIQAADLHSIIKNKETNKTTLLLDVRTPKDFEESHIDCQNIINIPENIITNGYDKITASIIVQFYCI